jgi:glycerophosphoryl diester phosphodiesterase
LHGHRGARGVWPENTLLGFQSTFDLGVPVVELDVLLTKDNVAVVTHNPTLMAATTRDHQGQWITSETLKVSDFTHKELRRFDVGGIRPNSAYAHCFPEQAFLFEHPIPTLDEVAKLACRPTYKNVWLNIEIKSTPLVNGLTPPPADLAEQVIKVIADNGLSGRVIVQSFDWRVLLELEKMAPNIPRSHLTYLENAAPVMQPNIYANSPWMAGSTTNTDHSNLCDVISGLGGKIWSPFHENIQPEQVARAQELGLVVNAWTVNEIADIDRVIDAGVDGIITDYPARVQRRLLECGLTWCEQYPAPC